MGIVTQYSRNTGVKLEKVEIAYRAVKANGAMGLHETLRRMHAFLNARGERPTKKPVVCKDGILRYMDVE